MVAMIPILLPAVARGAIPADPRRRRRPEVAVEEEGGVPVAAAVAGLGEGQGHHRRLRLILVRIPRPRLNAEVAGGDNNSGSAVARHHRPPPHRRARTVGAGAANGHLDDRADRTLLRDPDHRHRMTMVELPLGGEGREKRRPREEERRTRSFRLAGPKNSTMNKRLWWQHRWM